MVPGTSAIFSQLVAVEKARGAAHEAFLRQQRTLLATQGELIRDRMALLATQDGSAPAVAPATSVRKESPAPDGTPAALFDRAACLELATGSLVRVLGPDFAPVDGFPTRVRLPDEPLMLVDRIVALEGEPRSLSPGRVVTEHDVLEDGWYLDGGLLPTCIAVEAGQADLFLSGYLGIDFETRGEAVYRLLDAVVTFHDELPRPGQVVRYDIRIERFFRHGRPWFFHFHFDATVDGRPLLTMRNGCAGFFTAAELAAGQGIVQSALARQAQPGTRPTDWRSLAPLDGVESYDDAQVERLRAGDLAGCFGAAFAELPLAGPPATLPAGRMRLVDRVRELDPTGGRFGLGLIRAELDVHPDDWFLTCHFDDDPVMPGTLMYECCLHTLRIFLLRLGWVAARDAVSYQPVPEVPGQLKCRGQVIPSTRVVTYEVTVKELGYRPGPDPSDTNSHEPYAIVDALMSADGKPIVEITGMSTRLVGVTRAQVERLWAGASPQSPSAPAPEARRATTQLQSHVQPQVQETPPATIRPAIFGPERIRAFCEGRPSEAFGERYRVFDEERVIARLPRDPYAFLTRVVAIDGCRAWEMTAGGRITTQYDVPADAWYFTEGNSGEMPFAVLLEVALQPCGWLAAYIGSALRSEADLSFRNLGGEGVQQRPVTPATGLLAVDVESTRVSESGGMIIQHYDFRVRDPDGLVYEGDTYFGFFSKAALANQVGLRDVDAWRPDPAQAAGGERFPLPVAAPFPGGRLPMVDEIDCFLPAGGPAGLGFIRGVQRVDPQAWFFAAHFYQDPVVPGSLGLEAFLQLLRVVAERRWGVASGERLRAVATGRGHAWSYRGQVLPSDREVTVEAVVTGVDDAARVLTAAGLLWVDGRPIYAMQDFTCAVVADEPARGTP